MLTLVSCSGLERLGSYSKKEQVAAKKLLLSSIRPLLKSDEIAHMKCKNLGQVQVERDASKDDHVWIALGDLDLRKKAIDLDGNILSLSHAKFGNIIRYFADVYSCKEVLTTKFVDIAGMCKATEEKIFTLKYDPDDLREVGIEIMQTKIRYYAIANHFNTFHYRDIKYSYTKKEFTGKGYFFRCY